MVTKLDRRKQMDEYIVVPISRTTVPDQPPDLREELIKLLTTNTNMEWVDLLSDDPVISLSQKELDDIIERSKKIGAIETRLDSMNASLEAWAKRIDARLSLRESHIKDIKSRKLI